MGLIGWLVAIGCMLISAAIGIWGLTDVNRAVPIWLIGFPGGLFLLVAMGFEFQNIAETGPKPSDINRPWVGVTEVNVRPVQTGNSLETQIVYFNSGKSPAQNLRIFAHAQIRLPSDGPISIPNIPKETPKLTLWPNTNVAGLVFQGAPPMDQEIVRIITSGERIVWIAGKIEYTDSSNNPYITTFRFKYDVAARGYVGDTDGNHAN